MPELSVQSSKAKHPGLLCLRLSYGSTRCWPIAQLQLCAAPLKWLHQVLSTLPESWIALVGRANSSTQHECGTTSSHLTQVEHSRLSQQLKITSDEIICKLCLFQAENIHNRRLQKSEGTALLMTVFSTVILNTNSENLFCACSISVAVRICTQASHFTLLE